MSLNTQTMHDYNVHVLGSSAILCIGNVILHVLPHMMHIIININYSIYSYEHAYIFFDQYTLYTYTMQSIYVCLVVYIMYFCSRMVPGSLVFKDEAYIF